MSGFDNPGLEVDEEMGNINGDVSSSSHNNGKVEDIEMRQRKKEKEAEEEEEEEGGQEDQFEDLPFEGNAISR